MAKEGESEAYTDLDTGHKKKTQSLTSGTHSLACLGKKIKRVEVL